MENQHNEQPVFTVTELNSVTKNLLESELGTILIEGEISNFASPASGHWYFSLKDDKSQVRCAMFRLYNQQVACFPENGLQVLLKAKVSLYPNRGDYQLIVEQLHDLGAGLLQQQFEALKKQLNKEGLFDEKHKQPLPQLPKTIGIVTSASGAALRDILSVLNRRYPVANIIIYPTLVQGDQASASITRMINIASKRRECDVLIITRGGGSAEDLGCFNDEMLARAIFACPIPTVSGVGHQIDTTITDFVVDVQAPTPSAAAETVSPDRDELLDTLNAYRYTIEDRVTQLIDQASDKTEWLKKRLEQQHPKQQLMQQQQQVDRLNDQLRQSMQTVLQQYQHQLQLMTQAFQAQKPGSKLKEAQHELKHQWQRLYHSMTQHIDRSKTELTQITGTLNLLNPLNTLARGFSITTDKNGQIISSIQQTKPGERITTKVQDGELISTIIDRP